MAKYREPNSRAARRDRQAAKARARRRRRERQRCLSLLGVVFAGLLVCAILTIAQPPVRPDAQRVDVLAPVNSDRQTAPGAPLQWADVGGAPTLGAEPVPEAEPTPEPTPTPEPVSPLALATVPTIPPMECPTPEPMLRSARIRAVGDLMVHEKQLKIARLSDGSYDFHPQYSLIADSLADADYTIANLETTIGKYGKMDYSGYPMFNTPEALLDAVKDAGVDFLTMANNHMLDRYLEGMIATVNHVEEYGFDHGGANRTQEEHDTPNVIEVNGIRLGMLCYTEMTNGMEHYCREDVSIYAVNYLRKADIAADVQALRDKGADIVIAMPHWGSEYLRQPESYNVNRAKRMIAAGVDIILASHPHMVQPVKRVEVETESGETRVGLVAYSLGNFISNMTKQYTDSGIILDFTLQEQQDGSFAVENVGYVPIFCWRQESQIRAISSLKYYEERPSGMSDSTWKRMKASCRELRDLLGENLVMLAE